MDSNKAPYFIVLAISALAWSIGQFYGTVVTSPIVEFSFSKEQAPPPAAGGRLLQRLTLELQNITDRQSFASIIVWLRPSDSDASNVIVSTDAVGHGDPTNIRSQNFKFSARIDIQDAQPHESYIATIDYPADVMLRVSFDSGTTPIRFLERGLITRSIRFSQELMIWAVIGIAVIVIGWLIWSGADAWHRNQAKKQSSKGKLAAGGSP